jgi:lactate permease
MDTLVALGPLLLVIGLLASGKTTALNAGTLGLVATLIVATGWVRLPLDRLAHEAGVGLWLSWLVISIIASGMFFHLCTQTRGLPQAAAPGRATPQRLWSACFLLAPFAESVTGFGVGYIVALGALQRLGVHGITALMLGLFSQSLVPWGALAVGTTVGASLASMPVNQLGLYTALLQAPIHALYLLIYWQILARAGIHVPALRKLDDLAWTVLLLVLLALANAHTEVEIAGAGPTALLLAIRYWRDERPSWSQAMQAMRAHAPYVGLTLALCATRLVPPLRDALRPLWVWQPFADQPAFAPLYAAGFWLLLVGTLTVWRHGAELAPVIRQTLRGAWRSCGVTLSFLVMAQLYVGAGLAAQLASALQALAGDAAVGGIPLFSAVSGFLTGSGAASNAMLMPMVNALASGVGVSIALLAAVQNSVCTNLSMLSPIRVSMGVGVMRLGAGTGKVAHAQGAQAHAAALTEADVYRRALPLALAPVAVGLAAVAAIAMIGA